LSLPILRIYSKPDCHLCDVAKEVVRRVAMKYPLQVEVVNILEDPEAHDLYKEEIPVGVLDGRKIFKYRIDEDTLIRAVTARLES
jgi:hypothetical protein